MKQTHIILCEACKGKGYHKERICVHEYELVDCRYCGGSGRILEIVERSPYKG